MDRKYVMTALGYAILGMGLGIFMAASKNHGQMVTHAHIMLVGFVVSFIYALCYKLWLDAEGSKLASAQFWIHQFGALLMTVGLFLYYGKFVTLKVIDPYLAVSSIAVIISMILMKVLFIKSKRAA